jgi:hypothetical protein
MEIAGLGEFDLDEDMGWHFGPRKTVKALGDVSCTLILDGYRNGESLDGYRAAVEGFLEIGPAVLEEAAPHVFRYYQDSMLDLKEGDEGWVEIESPAQIWKHVRFGEEAFVRRRKKDKVIYISLECSCDWDREHGLQIVFKNGRTINKVGQFDSHLTNSDAYAAPRLESVVYVSRDEL